MPQNRLRRASVVIIEILCVFLPHIEEVWGNESDADPQTSAIELNADRLSIVPVGPDVPASHLTASGHVGLTSGPYHLSTERLEGILPGGASPTFLDPSSVPPPRFVLTVPTGLSLPLPFELHGPGFVLRAPAGTLGFRPLRLQAPGAELEGEGWARSLEFDGLKQLEPQGLELTHARLPLCGCCEDATLTVEAARLSIQRQNADTSPRFLVGWGGAVLKTTPLIFDGAISFPLPDMNFVVPFRYIPYEITPHILMRDRLIHLHIPVLARPMLRAGLSPWVGLHQQHGIEIGGVWHYHAPPRSGDLQVRWLEDFSRWGESASAPHRLALLWHHVGNPDGPARVVARLDERSDRELEADLGGALEQVLRDWRASDLRLEGTAADISWWLGVRHDTESDTGAGASTRSSLPHLGIRWHRDAPGRVGGLLEAEVLLEALQTLTFPGWEGALETLSPELVAQPVERFLGLRPEVSWGRGFAPWGEVSVGAALSAFGSLSAVPGLEATPITRLGASLGAHATLGTAFARTFAPRARAGVPDPLAERGWVHRIEPSLRLRLRQSALMSDETGAQPVQPEEVLPALALTGLEPEGLTARLAQTLVPGPGASSARAGWNATGVLEWGRHALGSGEEGESPWTAAVAELRLQAPVSVQATLAWHPLTWDLPLAAVQLGTRQGRWAASGGLVHVGADPTMLPGGWESLARAPGTQGRISGQVVLPSSRRWGPWLQGWEVHGDARVALESPADAGRISGWRGEEAALGLRWRPSCGCGQISFFVRWDRVWDAPELDLGLAPGLGWQGE